MQYIFTTFAPEKDDLCSDNGLVRLRKDYFMDKKRIYVAPSIEVVWLTERASLLAASADSEIEENLSLDGFGDFDE